MNGGILIAQASLDDVFEMAQRRTHNEHDYRLYVALAHESPNGAMVARSDGVPVGIAVAHALDDECYLSDLYVEPSFRSNRVGIDLLQAAAAGSDAPRAAFLESGDPAPAAFFARVSLPLRAPVLEVSGAVPHANELERMAAGEHRFGTQAIDPNGHAAALGQLDREVRGSARPADHLFWCAQAGGVVFTRGDELAGYAYVWPSGRIGPIAATSATYLVQMLAYALASLRATYSGEWCTLLIPGDNTRTLRACMRAGLRIGKTGILAIDSAPELARYVGFHRLLF